MRRVLPSLVFLLAATFDSASAQTQIGIGSKPSKRAQAAMPLARCLWKQRYAETLAFAQALETGLKAQVARDRLAALQQGCSGKGADGDVVAAILHSRQAAVGDCLAREAAAPYRRFRAAAKNSDSAAARAFVERGFPEDLREAAATCDITLTYDFAQSERTDFGGRVLGWQ